MDNNISTVIAQDKTQMSEHVLLAGHVVTMEPAIYVIGKKYQTIIVFLLGTTNIV